LYFGENNYELLWKGKKDNKLGLGGKSFVQFLG